MSTLSREGWGLVRASLTSTENKQEETECSETQGLAVQPTSTAIPPLSWWGGKNKRGQGSSTLDLGETYSQPVGQSHPPTRSSGSPRPGVGRTTCRAHPAPPLEPRFRRSRMSPKSASRPRCRQCGSARLGPQESQAGADGWAPGYS